MFAASIKIAKKYDYLEEKFAKAYDWLKNNDITSMKDGRYEILP
ncbi:MAG TPA: YhcH/YjgK/YiaL family protein, partial [Succinivibrionaceae bacterium]|nr:YhcH/YjgK/YiaL family protein [Succinivibrionaceae bacterium]